MLIHMGEILKKIQNKLITKYLPLLRENKVA